MNKLKAFFFVVSMSFTLLMVGLPTTQAQQAPPPKPEPAPLPGGCLCQISAECRALNCKTYCRYDFVHRVGYCE